VSKKIIFCTNNSIWYIKSIFTLQASGGVDLSVLIQPVHTTTRLTGMRQALHALESGTPEMKRVLIDEVNLVYECRVCLAMFRSLANLLAHKRHYCRHRQAEVRHEFAGENGKPDGGDIHTGDPAKTATTTVIIEPEPVTDCCVPDPGSWGGNLATYSPSMELIKTAGILEELSFKQQQQFAPDRRKTLNAVLPRLTGHQRPPLATVTAAANLTVRLEPVYSTANALYQSWHLTDAATGERLPSVRDINMALQRIVIADEHTVVGPDGCAVDSSSAASKQGGSSSSGSSGGDGQAASSGGVTAVTNGQAKAVNGGGGPVDDKKASGAQADIRKVVESRCGKKRV
jgi:hypothetical protein